MRYILWQKKSDSRDTMYLPSGMVPGVHVRSRLTPGLSIRRKRPEHLHSYDWHSKQLEAIDKIKKQPYF